MEKIQRYYYAHVKSGEFFQVRGANIRRMVDSLERVANRIHLIHSCCRTHIASAT